MSDMREAVFAQSILAGCVLGSCLFFLATDVQSATNTSATLQWAANVEPDLAGYRIYHGTTPGVYGNPRSVGNTTTYQFSNLASEATHYFTITAFDTSGNESLPSPEVNKHIKGISDGAIIPVNSDSDQPLPVKISNLTVASGRTYVVSPLSLQAGGSVFIDRSYTVTAVPANVQGAAYIQTANDDKAATNANFLSFTVNEPVMVSVARDTRITTKPAWLGTFTDTNQNVQISSHSHPFRIFARSFPAGTITLGSNASGGEFSMYSVFVQPYGGNDSPIPSTNMFWRNTQSGEVAVWLMNGMTITSVGFPGGTSMDWNIAHTGDMNGDGHTDVLWRNSTSGVVAIWLMNKGTILSSGFLGGVPAEWEIQDTGDLNGNGKADIIWRNATNGLVAVWFMNGHSVTSARFLGSTPRTWQIEKVGDMNGDGKADVVWQHQANGTVAVWLMNGGTLTSVGFPASTSKQWKIQSVGDANGDGRKDVLWRHMDNGMVAVWLMNGTSIASTAYLGGVPLDWEIKQVSDMNGDGKGDVVLQNQTNGVVAVWLLDGAGINSVRIVGSAPAKWKIH